MRNTTRRQSLQWIAAAGLAAGLAACGGSDPLGAAMNVDLEGLSVFDSTTLVANLATYPMQTLSDAEIAGLLFMREEETLAQAVYAASASRWPAQPIFGRIASSEATHTAAVKTLLDRYSLADPLAGLPLGTFATPAFQVLFNDLTALSDKTLIDALKVGVQIEELDIRDIVLQIALTDNQDIALVYDNLLRGSRNHLRAFMKVLVSQGGTYTPQYISQSDFDAIVNSPMEKGR